MFLLIRVIVFLHTVQSHSCPTVSFVILAIHNLIFLDFQYLLVFRVLFHLNVCLFYRVLACSVIPFTIFPHHIMSCLPPTSNAVPLLGFEVTKLCEMCSFAMHQ